MVNSKKNFDHAQKVSLFTKIGIIFKSIKVLLFFRMNTLFMDFPKGAFKYYVIKEVGGWGQKMEILDDLQHCKSSESWVGGPKKVKNMMT